MSFESVVCRRWAYLFVFSMVNPPQCSGLPWHRNNLDNYRANKVGARPKKSISLSACLSTPCVRSESDRSHLPSAGVARLAPASLGPSHFKRRFGRSEAGQHMGRVLWVSKKKNSKRPEAQNGDHSAFHAGMLCWLCLADILFPVMTFQTTCRLWAAARQPLISLCLPGKTDISRFKRPLHLFSVMSEQNSPDRRYASR